MSRIETIEGVRVRRETGWMVIGTSIRLRRPALEFRDAAAVDDWYVHARPEDVERLRAGGVAITDESGTPFPSPRAEWLAALRAALGPDVRLRQYFCVYRLVDRPEYAVSAYRTSGGRHWRAVRRHEENEYLTWRSVAGSPHRSHRTRRAAMRALLAYVDTESNDALIA